MSRTLHELATEIEACIDLETGELDVEQWGALQLPFMQKVESTVKYIENRKSLASTIRDKVASQRERISSIDNNVKWLSQYLVQEMQHANKNRIDTSEFRVIICKNSQPTVEVLSEKNIPPEYITEVITQKIDRQAIGKEWKITGDNIDGVIVTQGHHVRIK